MISDKVFLLVLSEKKQKRPGGGGIWPNSGKKETVVNKKLKIQTTKIIDCSDRRTNA